MSFSRKLSAFPALVALIAMVFQGLSSPAMAAPQKAVAGAKPVVRAVVIGASGYKTQVPLIGAYNDATLIADTLIRDGASPDNVTLLVDKPDTAPENLRAATTTPDGIATRNNILGALKQLVAATKAGDEVVITFSGHGIQQPEAVAGSEPDGLDEVFLPIDMIDETPDKKWGNAILDDEIGDAIDAVRAKGGNVTYIADFCHSGDSQRGSADGKPAARPVSKYGVPLPKIAPVSSGPFKADLGIDVKPSTALKGAYVGFLAAPSDTQAKQAQAPKYAPAGTAKAQGLVSAYTMMNLDNPKVVTYRDLAARVNSNIDQHVEAPRPLFDGDLDRPVLGGALRAAEAAAARSWIALKPATEGYDSATNTVKLTGLTLSAGALNGVLPDSIVALALPAADGDKTILYGKVASVDAYSAKLVPASYNGVDVAAWNDVRDSRDPKNRPLTPETKFVASVVQAPVPLDFAIALPDPKGAASPSQAAALKALAKLSPRDVGATFVPAGKPADLVLTFDPANKDVLKFADPSGTPTTDFGAFDLAAAAKGPGDPALTLQGRLGEAVLRAVRFNRMRKVVAAIGTGDAGTATEAAIDKVKVEFFREAGKTDAAGHCVETSAPRYQVSPSAQPVTEGNLRFERCDWLFIKLTNTGDQELYVNPIVFSPDGGILLMKGKRDNPTRFAPGQSGVLQYWLTDAVPDGALRDDLVVLVMDASDGLAVNFAALAQCPVVPDEGDAASCARTASLDGTKTRGSGEQATSVESFIDSALNGGSMRSGTPSTPLKAGALRFSWQTATRPGETTAGSK